MVTLGARLLLRFPPTSRDTSADREPENLPFWKAPIKEFLGVAPRFGYGVLFAAMVTGMLVTLIVRGLGLDLPYQYSPNQLLR